MNSGEKNINPKSLARECAVKFLYQCECEKLYHFSEPHFASFISYFSFSNEVAKYAKVLSIGTIKNRVELDKKISDLSENWKIERMAVTDRLILRVAAFEMLEKKVPYKVVINEAVEIAKKFGTQHSGSFVNAILDKLAIALKQ